jgi:hypothetical protein
MRNRLTVRHPAASPAFNPTLRQSIHRFQVADYAREYFREHHTGIFRRRVPMETLSQWQSTPISGALLKSVADKFSKLALKMFKLILSYTGADPPAVGDYDDIVSILAMVTRTVELRDELFFQLIKQTQGCSLQDEREKVECEIRTWQIFLVAATAFPSTRNAEIPIRQYLSQVVVADNERAATIASFTLMRFNTRCLWGKPLDVNFDVSEVLSIVNDPWKETPPFAASLEEHMWAQRKRYPLLPVPRMPHLIATAMLAQGAERREGIFRLPGNGKTVKKLIASISKRLNVIEGAELNDLASLFKSWYGSLPESLVSKELVTNLGEAAVSQQYVDFADGLPELSKLTLMYLIGFLRKLSLSVEFTKMTPRNLAICFAPNIVDLSGIFDTVKATQLAEVAQQFMVALIEEWDVTEAYPPTEAMLTRLEEKTK